MARRAAMPWPAQPDAAVARLISWSLHASSSAKVLPKLDVSFMECGD